MVKTDTTHDLMARNMRKATSAFAPSKTTSVRLCSALCEPKTRKRREKQAPVLGRLWFLLQGIINVPSEIYNFAAPLWVSAFLESTQTEAPPWLGPVSRPLGPHPRPRPGPSVRKRGGTAPSPGPTGPTPGPRGGKGVVFFPWPQLKHHLFGGF